MSTTPDARSWHRRHPWGVACLAAAVLIAAPAALAQKQPDTQGEPINIGVRNPSGGQTVEARNETQIIARTERNSYGTRQSNKGDGGGAIYGCRSKLDTSSAQAVADPERSTACIRANNLSDGKAFDFAFKGIVGGIIQSGNSFLNRNDKAAPFATNATGVALGLNADRVDNQHASELIANARKKEGLDADTVDGKSAEQIVNEAKQAVGAACPDGTVAAAGTCVESSPREAATYSTAAGRCGTDGRRLVDAAVLMHARSLEGIDLGDDEMSADVQHNSLQGASYITVADDGTIGSQPTTTAEQYRCSTG